MDTLDPAGMGRTPSSPSSVWFLRLVPLVSVICLGLAMTAFPSGKTHNFLVGLVAGLLAALTVQCFAIKSVQLNDAPQPSDVQDFRITP